MKNPDCVRFTALILALLFTRVAAQSPARDQANTRDSVASRAGSIEGTILAGDTGRPLPRATVRLTALDNREVRSISADAYGHYRFIELSAGRFKLSALKPGYAQVEYAQKYAFQPGKTISLRQGERLERTDIALPRAAVITGRVLDEYGDPVMDASTVALRYQFMQGKRRLVQVGRPSTTNDNGEFRLFGLLSGDYYVSARRRELQGETTSITIAGSPSDDALGYVVTYFPNAVTPSGAERMRLSMGQILSGADISLSTVRTGRIAGRVWDHNGRLMTSGFVTATPRSDPSLSATALVPIKADGTFTFNGVTPADYTVMSVIGNPTASGAEYATNDITVTDGLTSQIDLYGVKPLIARGRVNPESIRGQTPALSSLSVSAEPFDPDVLTAGSMRSSRLNMDGTFEMEMMAGRALVKLAGIPRGWYLKSVSISGEDITETGYIYKAGTNPGDIVISLTDNAPIIITSAHDDRGNKLTDFVVLIFAQDHRRWVPTTRMISVGRPDQDGKSTMVVPSGLYYAVALDYMEPGQEYDVEFLDRLVVASQSIVVDAGKTLSLDLTAMSTLPANR